MTKPVARLVHLHPQLSQYRGFASTKMRSLDINSKYKMLSGYDIPALGHSVYQTSVNVAEDVTLHAFKSGYRHVDSARSHGNEQPCADAMKKCKIPRGEIFFTSKVPPRSMGYDRTKASIESSFKETGLDYIDLYLIHAPYGGTKARNGTWLALVEAKRAGLIRSIGVTNYHIHHLDELESYIKKLEGQYGNGQGGEISVGQWLLHPWLKRPDIVEWCQERGVVIEAHCPYFRGVECKVKCLQVLGKKYGKTPAQVLVRWTLQEGFVPLPKSVTHSGIEENADVYDFELTAEDVNLLHTAA